MKSALERAAEKPLFKKIKHFLIGMPIATKFASGEKLSKKVALSTFSSDALSSIAYATEEIMIILQKTNITYVGFTALWLTTPISWAICTLMLLVVWSYYQTIHAYPNGGGSYLVAKENLGKYPGLIAGASLLIDYILTVSVSVTAASLAIISFAPQLHPYLTLICIFLVFILTVMNLRGTKDSGLLFAIPTYTFIVMIGVLIIDGFFTPSQHFPDLIQKTQDANWNTLSMFLVLRAFSSGCCALTGIEAIANGVPEFKDPKTENASKTLLMMAAILISMFGSVSYLATKFHIHPMPLETEGYQTVLSMIALKVFGESFGYYALQIATAGILFSAANTAYADFPRLSSIMARDGYLPRVLSNIGDRLVFQNGIILLSSIATLIIIYYKGNTSSIVPLYAVGVFISYTLSQLGMVVRFWNKQRNQLSLLVNFSGGLVTGIVVGVILITKFSIGAWVVPLVILVFIFVFNKIHNHYVYQDFVLSINPEDETPTIKKNTVLLLVPKINKGIVSTIAYARATTRDCRALHVVLDQEDLNNVKRDWEKFGAKLPLVILDSPYRSLIDPVIEYIDQILLEDPEMIITVIVPQAVVKHAWQNLLHSNAAVRLKMSLASRRNVVITNVRYFID